MPSGSTQLAQAVDPRIAEHGPRQPVERDVVALLGEDAVDLLGGGDRLLVGGRGPRGVEGGVDVGIAQPAEVERQLTVGEGVLRVPPEVLLVDEHAGVLAPGEHLELGHPEHGEVDEIVLRDRLVVDVDADLGPPPHQQLGRLHDHVGRDVPEREADVGACLGLVLGDHRRGGVEVLLERQAVVLEVALLSGREQSVGGLAQPAIGGGVELVTVDRHRHRAADAAVLQWAGLVEVDQQVTGLEVLDPAGGR